MKARPILFSGAMIRALLAGTKTQTRRIAKGNKHGQPLAWLNAGLAPAFVADPGNGLCPYGVTGDLLIVRETTQFPGEFDDVKPTRIPERGRPLVNYVADGLQPGYGKQRPAIHMPRWASRLTLEITDVRVERLQEISGADALAEGVVDTGRRDGEPWAHCHVPDLTPGYEDDPEAVYSQLWEIINGNGAWASNPWVWAVSFKVHRQNVDALLSERCAA